MKFFAAGALPRWRTDAFLAMAVGLNYADRSILPAIFPGLRGDLGLSDVTFGVLGSLFLWSYALCGPFAGMLADRYSRRLQVMVSLAAWSGATLLAGAATGFLMLAALRIVLGITEALYLPAGAALLGDLHGPATRGRAMGLQLLSQSAGVILGSACAGFIAERYGWRLSFVLLGSVGIALALVAGKFLGKPPAPAKAGAARASAGESLRYLLRTPTFVLLLVETILGGSAVWIFFNWMPLYLYEVHGMKMGEAGFAGMAMLQGASMLGIVAGAAISDRAVRRSASSRLLVFGLAYLAAAPCLLIFLSGPTYGWVVASVAGFSFLRALGSVNELPVLCDVIPPPFRSTAIGIFVACACAAGGAGILFAALLKQSLGLAAIFGALSGMFVIAGLALLFGHRRLIRGDIKRASAWIDAQPA
ncbi:MAG: hypothetical protein JWM88_1359 [Verrucomicrobia bacterium]|nr:hypothetical protein [Verrucomicrobiota bacterium]